MKSLTVFSHLILQDLGNRCHISTSRDEETITARVEHEGLSFLAITLPSFGKDFQKSLDLGFVAHTSFGGFRRWRGLPRFLGGFLELVFDRETGRLLDDPSIDAIFAVHQVTLLYGKILEPCSDARLAKAMDGYIQCENELRSSDSNLSSSLMDDFRRISSLLFKGMFSELDRMIWLGELIPKHGPGTTAEKLSANSKYSDMEWTDRLEGLFPFGENAFPNVGWYKSYQHSQHIEPGSELPVRVVAVPKTLKTPRIIAIEPTHMQYMQQAVLEAMKELVLRDDNLNAILGDSSQEPNRLLARRGSQDGSLATLDLSEASDRVSNQLVRNMLHNWPHLHEAFDATRSRTADVPGHGVIRLAKFASMGSALCFMAEGLVFSTIVFLAIEKVLKRRLTTNTINSFVGRVRVYGDDIIVPVEMVESVIEHLEAFGLKVNSGKSFWNGKFRESCGGDYYDGRMITPVRVRRNFPSSRKHVDEIISTVSLRNLLFEAGYERSVQYLDDILVKVLPHFPEIPRNSPVLGRWSHNPIWADSIGGPYQLPLIKGCVVSHRLPSDRLEGSGALMKWFLKRGDLPFADKNHLQRAGRPVSADIKTRWVSIIEIETVKKF